MTPLVQLTIPSIYKLHGVAVPLPTRMARCPPDVKEALKRLAVALEGQGGKLVLSDLFRSYDMQLGSHQDYVSGKKSAFSPPPGGSLHEAGRSFDLHLDELGMKLSKFWKLAASIGIVPIIDKPDADVSEAWHFECRGSHVMVYEYYKAGKGANFDKPYKAMAASAIVSVGVRVDKFGEGQQDAYVQSGMIRLGQEIGNFDGRIGPKSRDAMAAAGFAGNAISDAILWIDDKLQRAFPEEFFGAVAGSGQG